VVDVRLRVGTPEKGVNLWSRITLRASRELNLKLGMPVFALVKAVALDRSNYVAIAQSDANKSL
jgi:molybdopterin-binding protein